MNDKDNGFSDKMKSAVNKVKGEAKDQWGNATGDTSKQAEGKFDKAKGEVQKEVGEFKDKWNDK
ncbi:CsbD family protein [Bhargavaea ullalensis]|uniref:Uncharacterized protein YjbJ (UPF0337 family) n=1 Tax=Bhargavaea ullalensis TaxID=1265685 RepID=A0ABV2GF44_9BACL